MRQPSTWSESDTRVRMLTFVSESPKTWHEVQRNLDLTPGNMYTHSVKLEEAGLLRQEGSRPTKFLVTSRGFSAMASYLTDISFTVGSLRLALTHSGKL